MVNVGDSMAKSCFVCKCSGKGRHSNKTKFISIVQCQCRNMKNQCPSWPNKQNTPHTVFVVLGGGEKDLYPMHSWCLTAS